MMKNWEGIDRVADVRGRERDRLKGQCRARGEAAICWATMIGNDVCEECPQQGQVDM